MVLNLELKVTGVEINYYFVCKKKLWFFSHGMGMEVNSTLVEIGKEVHNDSYQRESKEIMIDNIICLDFLEKELVVNETKLTKSMEEATRFQLLYYLYYMENKGVQGLKGVIRYPKAKRTEELVLTQEYRELITKVVEEISDIRDMTVPPHAERSKKCNKCSYFELCFC
jgi:CRISPR-associated exonuclease Cas4